MTLNRKQLLDPPQLEARLAALAGAPAAEALALLRGALGEGRAALRRAYFEGAPPQELLSAHAWLVDELLTRAWRFHARLLPAGTEIALAAVGGYGRGELYPASDIDLMILLPDDGRARAAGFIPSFLSFTWDMGLEVGHSVRTLRDCVRESKKDITVVTNLMEARLLAGHTPLFRAMQTLTGPQHIWPSRKFFAAKWQEQIARHHHFDDTAYNLEPNLKEGPGGLRDIQTIGWVTQRHYGTATLHDLVERKFLSEGEYRALARGQDLLARLRCGLHHLAGHREDRLLFDYQRPLAREFQYRDRPGSLAVEQFMKHYYRTVRELALLNEILLQHFQEEILARVRPRTRTISAHFQARGGFLEVRQPKLFERTPAALLELFLVLQQQPRLKGVRAHTIRLLRANLARIDPSFRKDPLCRELFMRILRQPRGITHELRRMNAYGVLGAYLPVFGRIVGQMQHDLFHVYTVDEHSLFVLRNLRRFTVPEFRREFPLASELIRHLARPERLYIAALFHDVAKGRGGDHSELGEKEVLRFCRRHGIGGYDARLIAWLVRHHLVMSWTAQREDISDPEVVLRFAQKVGDQEHLDNLYLLTVADIRGTSPKVWNVWKGRLLSQLYAATTRVLRRGFASPIDLAARIADLRREAAELLRRRRFPLEPAERFWERLDKEYFLRHDAQGLAWHAQVIAAARVAELPLVATRFHPEAGGTEFLVFAPDRDDLFAVLTGGFDRLNLSIWDARIHTTRFGFALDTFVVLDHAGNPVTDPKLLAHLARALREQLLNPRPGRETRGVSLPRVLRHFPIPTRVGFSPSPGGQVTLMEVTAQDRPGLLYQVALALAQCKVRLVAAKVATYGERAEDIFFITDRDGQPLGDPAQLACLEAEIARRLEIPAPAETGSAADAAARSLSF